MSPPDHTRHPLTVLVVDDLIDSADSLVELLSFYGHAAVVAYGGEDALRSIAAEVPDLIFMDLEMPHGPDGWETAERVRAYCTGHQKQPLLVALTGRGADADRVHSGLAGFDLHLVKPVDPAALVGLTERFSRLLTPVGPATEPDRSPQEFPDGPTAPWSARPDPRFV